MQHLSLCRHLYTVFAALESSDESNGRGALKEIVDDVERWRQRGERVAIATVVATRKSAPRPVGAKFAVSESGQMCGSVSGGCVENDVFEHAKRVISSGEPQLLSYGISDDDALTVGLPCGGEIDVFVELLD
jgi:xanthine/CO dehydrogenase XdhC/CoxF family maturation factor